MPEGRERVVHEAWRVHPSGVGLGLLVASILGEPRFGLAPGSIDAKCVLDAGNTGVIMTSDRVLEPRDHAWLIPGPEAHWAKLAFEM